jgi:hypothetical protein
MAEMPASIDSDGVPMSPSLPLPPPLPHILREVLARSQPFGVRPGYDLWAHPGFLRGYFLVTVGSASLSHPPPEGANPPVDTTG